MLCVKLLKCRQQRHGVADIAIGQEYARALHKEHGDHHAPSALPTQSFGAIEQAHGSGAVAAKGGGADEHEVRISETFMERRSLDKIEGVEHRDFSARHIAALILQPRGQAGDHGSRDRLRAHVFLGELPRCRIVVEAPRRI